jgi:hypothetical protein
MGSGDQRSGAAVPAVGEGVPTVGGIWSETLPTAGGTRAPLPLACRANQSTLRFD